MNHIKVISFFIFFMYGLNAHAICEKKEMELNTHYDLVQEKIKKQFLDLSNHHEVKMQADFIFEKLIKAKSKIILDWIQKRKLVKENQQTRLILWRLYYLENFVLSRFPTTNIELNQTIENVFKNINSIAFTSKIRQHFEEIFAATKKISMTYIDNLKIPNKTKDEISRRVSKIRLNWPDKLESSPFKNAIADFFKWGIAYDPVSNKINLGIESLKYKGDETLIAVFAHEIGHSFDSCRWGAFFTNKNPFENVYSCLRKISSVGAKKRDDSQMDFLVKTGKLSKEMSIGLRANPTCNKNNYPPVGVQKDQLPESFADWFSAEVVSLNEHLSKALRNDLCSNKNLLPGSSYPNDRDRLDKIYLAHPKLAKLFGQNNSALSYCAFY